jgi:3-oxoacyl-[acyl-carrier-protein] synthase II
MMRHDPNRRVVITGIGVVAPTGIGKAAFWDSVSKGKSGVSAIEAFDTSPYRTKIAAHVDDFDPADYLTSKKIYVTDRFSQFALVAASEAINDSKLTVNDDKKKQIGVIWGTSEGGIATREEQYEIFFTKGPRYGDPMTCPKAMNVAAATHIAIDHGVTGLNYSITNTCSSGAVSVGEGYRLIKHGYTDVIIAGSSEAPITPGMLSAWCKLRVLSTRNDEPEKAVRPFSKDRDGPVLGEGSGALILESLEHALSRSAPIYAEVIGYWSNSDAYHLTFPNVQGEIDAMKGALEDADVSVEEVNYINAHGTGTSLNDKGETEAIKNVFGKSAYSIPVSSTKSMIGHLLGAAGTVEIIATIFAIDKQFLPPTINYETPDPECDLDYVPNKGREAKVSIAMSNSFGFGGGNAVVLFKRFSSS